MWILLALAAGSLPDELGSPDFATRHSASLRLAAMNPLRLLAVLHCVEHRGNPEARLRADIIRERRFPSLAQVWAAAFLRGGGSRTEAVTALVRDDTLRWHLTREVAKEYERIGMPTTTVGTPNSRWNGWWVGDGGTVAVAEALVERAAELRYYRLGLRYGGNCRFPCGEGLTPLSVLFPRVR